jgi:hypothetical protein
MSDRCQHQVTFNWQPGLLHELSIRLGSEINS